MPAVSRRKLIAVITVGAVLILFGGLAIVFPDNGEAVVAVSRFGSGVRLMADRPGLSLLPLMSRHRIDRREGTAVIAFPVKLAVSGEEREIEARVEVFVKGSGTLPIDAAAIRDNGWAGAWAAWAAPQLRLSGTEAEQLIRSSDQWREIFPGAGEAAGFEVGERLGPSFGALAPIRATVEAAADPEVVRAAAGREIGSSLRVEGRLVVLGLDALTWRLLDELIARGLMPNLDRLLDRGIHAEVIVRPPLLSPLIWTSIATGVHPEVHGVLDFIEPNPNGGEPLPISSRARKVPALWEIAAAAGRSSAVIGWWATFPAFAPPGATVYSDRLTEQIFETGTSAAGVAAPAEAADLARRLELKWAELTPEMVAPVLPVSAGEIADVPDDSSAWDQPIGGLLRLMASTFTTERLLAHELERGTEVVLAYLEGTDTVGHLFAPHRPPAQPIVDREAARRYGGVVDSYYAWVDGWIGRVVDELEEDDTLAIVSDHGFRWFEDRPLVAAGAHTATAENWHRKEGVFIAAGPLVNSSRARPTMELLDVAACLFELAGLPRGRGMAGSVPDWLLTGPRRVQDLDVDYSALVSIDLLRESIPQAALAPEVQDEQLAKLRALGYIGDETTKPAAAPVPGNDRLEARRLHNLALRYTDTGEAAEAETAYLGAIAADPTYVQSHFGLAFLLRNTGRFDEADQRLWQGVGYTQGDQEDNLIRVAQHYRQLGRLDRAGIFLEEARNRYPSSARIWLDLGAVLGQQGDLAGSQRCLERAIALDPRDPFAYRNLAALQVAGGDMEGAVNSLNRALELDPGNQEIRQQLQALGAPVR